MVGRVIGAAALATAGVLLKREVEYVIRRRQLRRLRDKYAYGANVRRAMGGPAIDVGTIGVMRAVR